MELMRSLPQRRPAAHPTLDVKADGYFTEEANREIAQNKKTKLAKMLVVVSAMAAIGFTPANALAESVKDSGGYDATYTKRDMQPIPDQDGHVLMLFEATGTATNPGGALDGFSVTDRGTADLRQGNGPQQGYLIFSKGSDQLIVIGRATSRPR
jgi:hypothetical protein